MSETALAEGEPRRSVNIQHRRGERTGIARRLTSANLDTNFADVADTYGTLLVFDIRTYLSGKSKTEIKSKAARSFFQSEAVKNKEVLVAAFAGRSVMEIQDLSLADSLAEWSTGLEAGKQSKEYVRKMQSAIKGLLAYLSNLRDRQYPLFEKAKFHFRERKSWWTHKSSTVDGAVSLCGNDISQHFGSELAEDIDAYRLTKGKGGRRAIEGMRRFFGEVLQWPAEETGPLLSLFKGKHGRSKTFARENLIISVNRWISQAYGRKGANTETVRTFVSSAVSGLVYLGKLPGREYPDIDASYFKQPSKSDREKKTLANLAWSELAGLDIAVKHRTALEAVRAASREVISDFEKCYKFMQDITDELPLEAGQERSARELARDDIRLVLQAEIESLSNTGAGVSAGLGRSYTSAEKTALGRLRRGSLWRDAGAPASVHLKNLKNTSELHALISAGLGPTNKYTLAVQMLFCCQTGWNKQPITDLPRRPVAFVTDTKTWLASGAYLESFKTRAGHEVQAFIEGVKRASGIALDKLRGYWTVVERDRKWQPFDQRAELSGDDELLDVLSSYQVVADRARLFDKANIAKELFFFSLSWNRGVTRNNRDCCGLFTTGILACPGVGFSRVRASFLQLKFREVGSIEALVPVAGHVYPNVLPLSYFNSKDMIADLERATRFFQNAVQALLVNGKSYKFRLALDDRDTEWFFKLAKISGVASAIGFGEPVSAAVTAPRHVFDATPSNLQGLILVHRALMSAQKRVGIYRWSVTGLPLLGIVIGIARNVIDAGLKSALWRAARQVLKGLKSGDLELPHVID